MSDEMMLNLVTSEPIVSEPTPSKEIVPDKNGSNKRERSFNTDESKRKRFKSDQPKPAVNKRQTKGGSKIKSAQLTKDFGSAQTKEEKAEKSKEIFDESAKGFEVINQRMKDSLEKHLKITRPTKVQLQSMPHILKRKDVLMKSKTGSGKTLAYLLPCLHLLQEKRTTRNDGTFMIIIAPTRELAFQITEVATVLLRQFPWLVFGSLMGGELKKREKARIRKGLSVVVATPGRLLDHLENTASFKVNKLEWLILDEADRLLDLGFERTLKMIMSILDERKDVTVIRQNLLISATLEGRIQKLANVSLRSPIFVNLAGDDDPVEYVKIRAPALKSFDEEGNEIEAVAGEGGVPEENFQVPKHLLQSYSIVETKQKLVALISFLRLQSFTNPTSCKVLVFVLTTDIVEFLFSLFESVQFKNKDEDGEEFAEGIFGVPVYKLHGNMTQGKRTSMFTRYRGSSSGILFCTDVAARGLDVPDISWIVQYDAPTETKEYVHRIGRTARCTGKGRSLIFLTPSETAYATHLQESQLDLKQIQVEVMINTLQIPVQSKRRMPACIQLQLILEQTVTKNRNLQERASAAFRSYIRGYSTYPKNLKYIFHVKSLHLGHTAKMFALAEAPSKLASAKPKVSRKDRYSKAPKADKEDEITSKFARKAKYEPKKRPTKPPSASQRMLSEFSAG